MRRMVSASIVALVATLTLPGPGAAEPVRLADQELDLVAAGYAGTYVGTLYEEDGTTELGTFTVKVAKTGKVTGKVSVTRVGKYKLSGLLVGDGFGAALLKGKIPSGGFFATVTEAARGFSMSGTWGVNNATSEVIAGGVLSGATR